MEEERGDNWDHTAIDAEHRLLLSIVPGKRTSDQCDKVVAEVKKRTGNRTDLLLTSDEHASYKTAIEKAYSVEDHCPEHIEIKKIKRKFLKIYAMQQFEKPGRLGAWLRL